MKKLAYRIRDAILADVTDRRGWRQEWNQFGEDVQQEIRKAWLEIIEAEIQVQPIPTPGRGGK